MKSKAPLSLMELAILVLVFAMAAAVCVRAFVSAGVESRRNAEVDRAVILCEDAASVLKSVSGDRDALQKKLDGQWTDDTTFTVGYSENWNVSKTDEVYRLIIETRDGSAFLGTARVRVVKADEEIYGIDVAWQKEDVS